MLFIIWYLLDFSVSLQKISSFTQKLFCLFKPKLIFIIKYPSIYIDDNFFLLNNIYISFSFLKYFFFIFSNSIKKILRQCLNHRVVFLASGGWFKSRVSLAYLIRQGTASMSMIPFDGPKGRYFG